MRNATKYLDLPESAVTRVLARYEVAENGCWLWTGSTTRDGYAQTVCRHSGRQWSIYPHVLAWIVANGCLPIEEVDHACHDPATCQAPCLHRLCINPSHLTSVTGRENKLRSGGLSVINAAKTMCPEGHNYDHADGSRRCSVCRARDKRRQYERRGAEANARRAEKMRTDPVYRARRLAAQRERSRSEVAKERRRLRYQNDPEYRERVKARVTERYRRLKAG